MTLDPTSGLAPRTTPDPAAAVPSGRKLAEFLEQAAKNPIGAGVFTATAELLTLIQNSRQQPEVRSDLVAAAAAKLASGELANPGASRDAARAILDVGASPDE